MKKLYILLAIAAMIFSAAVPASATTWSKYRIMIDPGHGGTDPGASGPTAPHEAELALACGLKLKEFITGPLGGTVKMTRETNATVSLQTRKAASVSYDPYIFCSIHLNAFNGTANGTETWYYWSTGNSKVLATRVHATLISEMNRVNRGVKQNGWTVITGSSTVPAILTEGMFVDNKTEHDLIKDKKGTGFLNWVRGHLYGYYDHLKNLDSSITNPRNVAAISGNSGSTDTTPTLKVSPTTLSTTISYEKAGVKDTVSFSLSGTNLAAAVSITSDNANFKPLTTSVSKADANAGTEVDVQWTPSAVGTETATITAKYTSGSTTLTKTVKITGVAETPPLKLTAGWIFSEKNGKATSKGWDATKVRNLDYYQGKLYMVYNDHKEIKVVNAQTGEDLGSLSTKGVSGGVLNLCDVAVFKGKVYACNLGKPAVKDANGNVTAEAVPLKIYRWADDNSDPEVVLETTSMSSATRVGDCMTFRGSLTKGDVVFGNDNGTNTLILRYEITNGTFAKKPTVTKATNTLGAHLVTAASTRVYATTDSLFWITGQHCYSTQLDKNGKQKLQIPGNETWGNDLARFKYNSTSQNYALETVYSEIDGKNYLKGQMRLIKRGANWAEPTVIQTIPAAGLSDEVSNTSCASSLAVSVTTEGDLTTVEAWMSINGQGVCYYISKDGKAPSYDVQPITPVEASITAPSSVTVPETKVGQTGKATIAVSGAGLNGDITATLTDATGSFSISPMTLSPTSGKVSKDITVTFKPTVSGSHSAVIKLTTKKSDGSTLTKNISVKATAVEAPVINSNVSLSADWIYSTNHGTAGNAPWLTISGLKTRDIAATENALYVLNAIAWSSDNTVSIINPETGQKTGSLNMSGISGGEFPASSLDVLGGKLLLSNGARATDVLKVYKWDSDAAAPAVFINDATHSGIYAGTIMSASGDMNNGRIWFSDGATVIYYTVTGGTASQTAVSIPLTKNGSAFTVGNQKGAVQIMPADDGSFWAVGNSVHPVHFNAAGEYIGELTGANTNTSAHGTSGRIFPFGDKTYGAFASYLQLDGQTLSGGTLSLVDMTDPSAPVHKSVQPENGLGTTRNTDFITSVSHVITDNDAKLHLYVAVPNQGVAKFSYNGNIGSSVDVTGGEGIVNVSIVEGNVVVEGAEAALIEVYTPDGRKVPATNLPKGIYLVSVKLTDGTTVNAKLAR